MLSRHLALIVVGVVAAISLIVLDRAYRSTLNDVYNFNVHVLSTYCHR